MLTWCSCVLYENIIIWKLHSPLQHLQGNIPSWGNILTSSASVCVKERGWMQPAKVKSLIRASLICIQSVCQHILQIFWAEIRADRGAILCCKGSNITRALCSEDSGEKQLTVRFYSCYPPYGNICCCSVDHRVTGSWACSSDSDCSDEDVLFWF